MKKPTKPEMTLSLYECVEQADKQQPAHLFIAEAVETIKNKYPNATDNEISVGGNKESGYIVFFERNYSNPNYEQELAEYNKQLAIYLYRNPDVKAEYEAAEERQEKFREQMIQAFLPLFTTQMGKYMLNKKIRDNEDNIETRKDGQ